jgi:hypothetical protein
MSASTKTRRGNLTFREIRVNRRVPALQRPWFSGHELKWMNCSILVHEGGGTMKRSRRKSLTGKRVLEEPVR